MRLTFQDWSRPSGEFALFEEPIFGVQRMPGGGERGIEVLAAGLFRLLKPGTNTIFDSRARAALRQMQFGQWLHAFISTQARGLVQGYDVHDPCYWGGLPAARPRDALASLRKALAVLEVGVMKRAAAAGKGGEGVEPASLRKTFPAVVTTGWTLTNERERWVLRVARC